MKQDTELESHNDSKRENQRNDIRRENHEIQRESKSEIQCESKREIQRELSPKYSQTNETKVDELKREPSRKYFPINSCDKSNFKPINGARKLKDHELSYFGLQVNNNHNSINNKSEGKLTSDKPDLLIHHSGNKEKSHPIYENIKLTNKIDMKLKEMTAEADAIQRAVFTKPIESKEKSPLTSKPFETIEEENRNGMKKMKSKGVQVSRGFNQTLSKLKSTSSASSNESINSVKKYRKNSISPVQPSKPNRTRKSSSKDNLLVVHGNNCCSRESSTDDLKIRKTTSSGRMHRTSERLSNTEKSTSVRKSKSSKEKCKFIFNFKFLLFNLI